jgi:hypothetical protein
MFSLRHHESWLGDRFTGMYIVDLMLSLSLIHGAIVCLHVDFSVANILPPSRCIGPARISRSLF